MTDQAPTYAPGTPVWVDLGSPDPTASARFYNQLFGWQSEDLGEAAGHYTMFRKDGKQVAAVGPLQMPGQPTVWSTYVSTTDAEETARKVTENGGQILAPPMVVMDQGSMAVFMDPTGAAFSVWQPDKMQGAELVNKPGSFSWNELATRDMDRAKDFYSKVFGWGAKSNDMPDGNAYIEWQVDGHSVGGGMTMGANYPADAPPHWLVYFTVDNTDNTVKQAQDLGGSVLAPAMDIPQGRMAVLADAHGAPFAVIQLA